ncbi:MAG: peptidoglycan DD-metalloendopeptidase family protein [candidate division WOR-3 bacterium]
MLKRKISLIVSSKKVVFSFLLFFIIFISIFADNDIDKKISENEKKLNDLKKQLNQIKERKDSLKLEETKTLYSLNKMDEEIYLTDLLIKQLETKDKLLTLKIDTTEKELVKVQNELNDRRSKLKTRVVKIYKKGKIHTFEVVFTSKSFADLAKRIRYLLLLAKQDKKLYDKVKKLHVLYQTKLKEYNQSKEQLLVVKSEVEKEKQELQNKIEQKKQFLKGLQTEQKKQTDIEKELIKSQESLQYLINKLRIAQKKIDKKRDVSEGKHYFDLNKGKVIWPANGKVISSYGSVMHPKYGTKTINNGIDIKVNIGDPIYAVYDGDIIYADKFLGYGNVVMIDHGNGYYTLYAHLSEIDVVLNQPVLAGEVIGKGGDTGSLEGPVLHFEMRKDGKPINPLQYLKKK